MKAEIVAKMDEYIQHILEKPEITAEDYDTLRCRLQDIRAAEERARQELEEDRRMKKMEDLLIYAFAAQGVDNHGM